MKCFNELFSNMYIKQDKQKHSTILSIKQRWYQNMNLSVGPTKAHQHPFS